MSVDHIKKAAALFCEPSQIVELRILNSHRGTVSGYFDDLDKLAQAASEWSGKAPGVYMTLNPLNPALLSRSANRLKEYVKVTTSDADIIQRRWLLIDLDPVRPPGISSTNQEHAVAIARGEQVAVWLKELRFPDGIVADSGNGAHLVYLLELPNTPEATALVKKCLQAIDLGFSDDAVKVDLTCFNAARIWKLYGTMACKGDSTPERPHRLAEILSTPSKLEVVSGELLQRIAAMAPEQPVRDERRDYQRFDIENWIASHGLEVATRGPWAQGGRKWILSQCPWNPNHTNRSSYIVELPTGALGAGCHHNGCAGKNWPDLRDAIEPAWRESKRNHDADDSERSKEPGEKGADNGKVNPWACVQDASTFLAEEEKEFKGIVKDLLVPGGVTMIAAPRGLGKTHVAEAMAVGIACGGVFRNEQVDKLRVLLLDRDNPRSEVKKRLKAWGAISAENLKVLTRETAPDLKQTAWESFPVGDYDVIVIDSVGSSTEGITEKEGKETTKVLATLLDVARKGPAILLLTNCTKDALNLKGRGEWADRVDILYEVRDATGFTPSGKRSWWQELPEAGESAWAERAARRKGRIDYRLAFIPSKFRLGPEPEPFCLEIRLPKDEPWTLTDLTAEVLKAGEEAIEAIKRKEEERLQKAAQALAEVVKDRAAKQSPILKTEAEDFLHEMEIPRKAARELITDQGGKLWSIQNLPGKGSPKGLYPLAGPDYTPPSAAKMHIPAEPRPERVSEAPISADRAQSGRQKYPPRRAVPEQGEQDTLFSLPGVVSRQEAAENDEEMWEETST